MKKSIISLIIVCCLVFALGVISTQAATYTGSCGTDVTYTLDTGTGVLTISGTGAMTDYTYSSSAPWDSYKGCINSVTIGNGVTSIGNYAFYDCSSLTSVTIPDSVTSIGQSAFEGCSSLTSVTIPDSVTSIGQSAFEGCSSLTEINWNAKSVEDFSSINYVFAYAGQNGEGIKVTFGDSVEKIPAYCFYTYQSSYAPKITSVAIGDSVTSIGNYAFTYCRSLTEINWNAKNVADFSSNNRVFAYAGQNGEGIKVTFGDSVEKIPKYCFYPYDSSYAPKITSVAIGEGVTSIGYYAFAYCSSLTSVTIGGSVTSIGISAFRGCSSLTSVTIPDSVTSIGSSAFRGCSGLTSVTIPDSVTSIEDYAFEYCRSLTEINWNAKNVADFSSSNYVFAYAGQSGEGIKVTFGDSVEKIPAYCFYLYDSSYAPKITSVAIGDSVTSIGNYAFYNCYNLTEINWNAKSVADLSSSNYVFAYAGERGEGIKVTFGDSVEKIPAYCFYLYDSSYAPKITSVAIGDSVTSIGKCAFYNCTGLASVVIGNSVTSIGNYAFYDCSSLTSVTIPDSVTSIGSSAFLGCKSLTSVTIPDSVTSIGDSAFYNCSSLTSVTIPDSVTSIGDSAFYNCSSLTSVIIPDGVTSIGNYAFDGCSGLTSVTIGGSVTSIGNYAFYNCYNLTSVTIPDSVTSIGDYAFRGCYNLTSVTIGDSVTSIGNYAFDGCSGLTSVTIPDSVTSIGSSAFDGCRSLTSVTIPDSVTSIGYDAFAYCRSLTSVIIPDSVTSIGGGAFEGCSSLEKITIPFVGGSATKNTYLGYIFGASSSSYNSEYVPASLKEVVISDACISIGKGAFKGCSSLEKITIPFVGGSATENTYLGYIFGASSSSDNSEYVPASLKEVVISDACISIGYSAFYDCSGLMSITIGNSVARIEEYAFRGCTGLASVVIGNSVTSIGNSAFYNCSSLTSVTIPDSVTSIGNSAFYNCSGLTSVTIGGSVTSIGNSAFYNCTALTEINWNAKNVTNFSSSNYVFAYAGQSGEGIKVTFGDNVEKIPAYCFYPYSNSSHAPKITSVAIGESVTSIEYYAFRDCSSLTSVTIPDSVTSIGNYAFGGCTGLTSVTIPDSVTSIGNYAFYKCYNLTEINWNAKNVADFSSSNCVFAYAGQSGEGIKVTFGDNVEKIPAYCFDPYSDSSHAPKITSVAIGNSVTSIGNSAFYNCSGLTSVTIPDSVTSIGSYAFEGCSGLTSVTIPDRDCATIGLNQKNLD